MDTSGFSAYDRSSGMPWFRTRPGWVLAVAATMFVAVFVLRVSFGHPSDATNMLYSLPIALLALAFGRGVGIAAGILASLLVWAWTLIGDVDLSLLGWMSRLLPLLLLGSLLGDASDRLAEAGDRQRALEAAAQRHRDATEVNDTLVQGMAAAKWALEAGRHEYGLATLTETLELGHELVSKLMKDGDMGPDGHRGSLGERR